MSSTARRYPPSLAPYAPAWYTVSGSSGAGSSRSRPPSLPLTKSDDSDGYRDVVSSEESDSSDESDGDKSVARDFIDTDEVEQRAAFIPAAKEEKDVADVIRAFERQKAEERALERLQRQQAGEAGVIDLDSD